MSKVEITLGKTEKLLISNLDIKPRPQRNLSLTLVCNREIYLFIRGTDMLVYERRGTVGCWDS